MSDAQKAVRAKTKLCTLSWQSLTDAQRLTWHLYATQHLENDWTGNPIRLTGYNWYVRINVRRQLLSQTIRTTVPTDRIILALRGLTVSRIIGETYIAWTSQTSGGVTEPYVECYGYGPHSAGSNPGEKLCKRIGAALEKDHNLRWTGDPSGTMTCFARLMNLSGVVSPWASIKILVT
jgi:hypothetical protein